MNYSLYWLVAESYRKGLIDREGFIRQWKNVQALEAMQENKRFIGFSYVIGLYKSGTIDRKEFIRQWGNVQSMYPVPKRVSKYYGQRTNN
jgi:hypothetical protein